jgi:hypothetical protein
MKRLKRAAIIAAQVVGWITLFLAVLTGVLLLGLIFLAKMENPSWGFFLLALVFALIALLPLDKIWVKHKKKIATAGAAYSVDYCVNWLFNYPLYIWVMDNAGLRDGYIIMFCLSFLLCYVYIKIYDIIKRDLFLLEDAKDWMDGMANYAGESKIKLFRAKIISKGGFISAFLIISLWKDPFYTLAFCRKGKYNGFSLRDWGIFLGSVAIGNSVWALSVFGGIEIFKWLFIE